MNISVKQVSSLEKVRPWERCDAAPVQRRCVMRGEYFSYQIILRAEGKADFTVQLESPLEEHVRLYTVKNNIIDFATYDWADDDYITKEPCLMPDMLMPLAEEEHILRLANESASLWVNVRLPEEIEAGKYPITVRFCPRDELTETSLTQTMTLEVTSEVIPRQRTVFSQLLHADCIADAHRVPVYSEEHWSLLDKYMALASELGVNMMLTPIISPPLDTKVGTTRPCTQLVKIEKHGEHYSFDFSLLKRWIDLCLKNDIKYFEMSHLFSQWGIKHAANIKVTENGKESYMFGWHTDARSAEYRHFLTELLPALIDFCKAEKIKDRCYFHISDEPSEEHIEAYKYAYELITPLIDGCLTLDAVSDYKFYEEGLIPVPVTALSHLESFIKNQVKNQWAYYYCGEAYKVSNRFLAMPSYRNRIIGLQLYKYDIKGFLQWGYNFYYSQLSVKKIDPYLTTSADKAFPSGDAFSVYPVENGVVPSLRAVVFREALNDIEVCRALERYIGRDAVIRMIDSEAGMDMTFTEYPRNSEFIPRLIERMEKLIKDFSENK